MHYRRWVGITCAAFLVYGILRFLYGGIYSPALFITGDFYSAFPAPFVELYNPVLLAKNIFRTSHVSLQGYWSYGPGFHLITLPLTLLSSYRLIDGLVLLVLWCSIGLAFWLMGRKLLSLTGWVEWSFLGLIWLNFTPLHASIGQRAIELPEMLLILWVFAYWEWQVRGGIGIAIAATLKFLPVVFIPYLIWKKRWKGVGAAVVGLTILLAAMSTVLPWGQSNSVKEYKDMTFGVGHKTTHANNQSLVNLIQRSFIEGKPNKLWINIRNSKQVRQWAGWVNLIALVLLMVYGVLRISSSHSGPLALECGLLLTAMVMLINRNQTYYLALTLPGVSAVAVQLFRESRSPDRKISRWVWAGALVVAYLMMSPPIPMRFFDWLMDVPLSTTLDLWKILGGPGMGGVLLLVVLVGVHARTVKSYELAESEAPETVDPEGSQSVEDTSSHPFKSDPEETISQVTEEEVLFGEGNRRISSERVFATKGGDAGGDIVLRFLIRRAGWLLIPVLGAALWVRFYGLGRIVDTSHDEVNPLLAGFRLTQSHFLPSGPWIENLFAQIFLYYNGASSLLIQFVNLEVLNLLGIPLQEFYLFLPYAICGILSIVGIYFLGKRWFDTPTGLLAATFATVAPYHGAISRINHPMVGIFVNQVFMFLVAEKLFDTRRKLWAVLFSLMLCVEVISNNGFPFTILLLVYYGWMRFREQEEPVSLTLKRFWVFARTTKLIWYGLLPLVVVLLQFGLLVVALNRGELVGLLAWSLGHKRPMDFSSLHPAHWHEGLEGFIPVVFGSAFGFVLLLAAVTAFIQNFRFLFRFEIRGLMVLWIVLLGLPFLGIFTVQEVHLIATCGIPVFLLSANWLVRGMTSQGGWLQGRAVLLMFVILIEAFSGSLAVNLGLKMPNSTWYNPAVAQGMVGGSHKFRGMKSVGYWIRKLGKPDGRVYVNKDTGLAELYLGKVICACGDPQRKRLFGQGNFLTDPLLDHIVLMEMGLVPEGLQKLLENDYHLVGTIYDGRYRLARIYSKDPGPINNFQHTEAVRRFDEEFARLDQYITSPYAGMSFWME